MVNIHEIILRAHAYRVPDLGINFRDRESEIEAILEKFPAGFINIVFGPRGCGKTELARALTYASNDSVQVLYLGYREEESTLRTEILIPDRSSAKDLVNSLMHVVEEVGEYLGIARLIVRGLLSIYNLMHYMRNRRAKPELVIVFVDEFRCGTTSLDTAKQQLELDANIVKLESAELSSKTGGKTQLKVVYFSSDASTQKLQLRVGSKCTWWLMWYLPREHFVQVLIDVKCPLDSDLLWALLGGNLREISQLRLVDWNLRHWIEKVCAMVLDVLRQYIVYENVDVNDVLKTVDNVVVNVDAVMFSRLFDYLLEHNVVMYVDARFDKISNMPVERWIGKYVAFQLPIYYWTFQTICERRSLFVTGDEVLQVVKKYL